MTLKYPGVTVLETARSCPGSVRTCPSTVKDRLGIPCKSTGTFLGTESRIRLAGGVKTLEEERCGNQDDHRESDFHSHQNFAHTASGRRVGSPAQTLLRIEPHKIGRRSPAEDQTASDA